MRRLWWAALLVGAAASLVVCYHIATHSILLGSREGGWYYGYIRVFAARSLWIWLLATGGCVALLAASESIGRRREWASVFLWFGAALVLQALVRSLTPFTFESIFTSDGANSFYSVTRRYSAATVLRDFADIRQYWPLHAQSNMPGKLLFVYALRQISRHPAALGWLVVLVSNLGGVILYFFVRDLLGDRRIASHASVLYFIVPAKLYFYPLLNTATPTLVVACAYLVLKWLRTANVAYAALIGVVVYVLILYEPICLVVGLFCATLVGWAVWRGEIGLSTAAWQMAVGAVACVATYSAVRWWFGFDLIPALRQVATDAVAFNAAQGRPYSLWIRQNLLDFAFGAGLCQAGLFIAVVWASLTGRLEGAIGVVALALTAVLLVTDLIGVNRGEVIRLWIFIACFFQIPAAYVCARIGNRLAIVVVVALTLLQDALGTAMVGFVVPG
jgi:hypothetical protein